jgi:starch synthase
MDQFKILFIGSEVSPFTKTSGIADVVSALPKALKGFDQEIRLMIPKYKIINERKYTLREVIRLKNIPVTINGKTKIANVKSAFIPNSKVQVYFVEIEDLFNRAGIYSDPKTKKTYKDNAERFAYFNKATLETLKTLSWQPDIIHCNDWQTAFTPVYLKTEYVNDPFFKGVKSVYTIHNLTNQGAFPIETAKEIDFDESQTREGGMFNKDGQLNLTKGAINFADFITTVSENHANEIISNPDIGKGLGSLLEEKESKFEGVLNGIDHEIWSPDIDKFIPENYDVEDLSGKEENKKILLSRLSMEYNENIPLVSVISPISKQKGSDIILNAVDRLLKLGVQLVIVGDGDREIAEKLYQLNEKYPGKFTYNISSDEKMTHLILAGSDLFLAPSRYEPCGLYQIYGLKYASIPVVSSVGGLFDTVEDYDETEGGGSGFVMESLDEESLIKAVERALALYKDKEKWREVSKTAMEEDFSWEISAKRYIDIYDRIVND